MKFQSSFWFLILFALPALTSCIHTAKVSQQFNAGGSLTPTDVVLFTGFNEQDSRTSKFMLTDTRRRLSKCGIEVIYLHDPGLNYEFMKAGFKATDAHVNNDDFIHQLRKVFKVSHIISVGSMEAYQGSSMPVNDTEIFNEPSGVVFEVYSLKTETIVSSMKVTGKTWQVRRGGEIDSESQGSIHVNYNKALKTLLKSSACR